MPFTFAHPAVSLPFIKRFNDQIIFTGLFVGSMAPDFEYFIRLKPLSTISHSVIGIIAFDLPLVILISYIFQLIIKKQFIIHLPKPFCYWYQGYAFNKWRLNNIKKVLLFMLSSLAGISSHILWDSFTHYGGYFVMRIPYLQSSLNLLGYQVYVYKILQHGSTLIGMSLIIIVIFLCRSSYKNDFIKVSIINKIKYWGFIGIITVLFLGIRILIIGIQFKINYMGIYIVTIITGFFLATTFVSYIFNKNKLSTRRI